MKRWTVLLLTMFVLLVAHDAVAQRRNSRPVRGKLFPDLRYIKPSGYFFGPGATYMMAPFWNKKDLGALETEELVLESSARPFGSPGLFAEVGRYHILDRWLSVEYLDYGLAYKSLRGIETYELRTLSKPDLEQIASAKSVGRFADHFVSGQFNLNNVYSFTRRYMMQNTLGANVDYAFMANRLPGSLEQAAASTYPPTLQAGIHYKFGLGLKVSEKLLLIPSLETPVLNLVKFEKGRSSLSYFNSRYRPIVFSVRVMMFRKQGLEACPPVYNPANPQELQDKLKKKQERRR